MSLRDHLPATLRREVRQRCGFGCVFCGMPLYDYEHIDAWAQVRQHEAPNITLLCPNHHRLVTNRVIPKEAVREADRSPHNRSSVVTPPREVWNFGSQARVVAGGNSLEIGSDGGAALTVDGEDLISFERDEGRLWLNLCLRDRNGTELIEISRNELKHFVSHWDYEFSGQSLTIRNAPRDIALEIVLRPEVGEVVIERAELSHNGVDIAMNPYGLVVLNNRSVISGSTVRGMGTAISVGRPDPARGPAGIVFEIPRTPYDKEGALEYARVALRRVREQATAIRPGSLDAVRPTLPPGVGHPQLGASLQVLVGLPTRRLTL